MLPSSGFSVANLSLMRKFRSFWVFIFNFLFLGTNQMLMWFYQGVHSSGNQEKVSGKILMNQSGKFMKNYQSQGKMKLFCKCLIDNIDILFPFSVKGWELSMLLSAILLTYWNRGGGGGGGGGHFKSGKSKRKLKLKENGHPVLKITHIL